MPKLSDIFIQKKDAVVEKKFLFPFGVKRKISVAVEKLFGDVIVNSGSEIEI